MTVSEPSRAEMTQSIVGAPVPRKEGADKVAGKARYVDDLRFDGMIWGATVRSPAPRGRIKAIHFAEGIPWQEFTIARASDIPGSNHIALITNDQPCLAESVFNHAEEPVVLLAHPDRYLLEEARRAAAPDTAGVPNSGPTVASRTCMVVGKLVESAARSLRQALVDEALLAGDYSPEQFALACAGYVKQYGPLRRNSQYSARPDVYWDDALYRGDAYGAYAWAVYVAEVSADSVTYETRVEDFVAVQEVGRVIHPVLAKGQIEGGVAQAIGYALYENVVWNNGSMANGQMTNYIIPTSADIPPMRVIFAERPYPHGPLGAKGIGELPMDGPAPAIVSAIENATAISLDTIPATPEALAAASECARDASFSALETVEQVVS